MTFKEQAREAYELCFKAPSREDAIKLVREKFGEEMVGLMKTWDIYIFKKDA